jgi:hypothetical protein
LGGVEVAARMLLTTASSNGTFDLTAGLSLLTGECVEEGRSVSSILANLASSVRDADVFSGAAGFFRSRADEDLALLLGSLSDGRGDLGGGTAKRRLERLLDEIWPDGVPSVLSTDEFVERVMNSPRSATMTPAELAAIWPLLPESGREHFAGDRPVRVLDLVVDGGLTLSDAELDAAARSVLRSPPSVDLDVDPDLQRALDAAAWDGMTPRVDRTAVALDRADILMDAGVAGREYRDAVNLGITYVMLVVGLQAKGTAERTDDGLIVVNVPRDAEISIDDLLGTRIAGTSVQPYGKGGTTFGNTFIVPERTSGEAPAARLLQHESVHTYQWAAAGPAEYGALYGLESVKSGAQDFVEHVDVGVNWFDIGPVDLPDIPSIDLPIPGKQHFPDWVPTRTPAFHGPDFHPPSIPIPDVDVEWRFNTACHNRFEQHADLGAGGYESCES